MTRFDGATVGRALDWLRGQQQQPGPPWQDTHAEVLRQTSSDTDRAVTLAAAMCRRYEGFRAAPYLCPAGVATIGYGSTSYADGSRVLLTDPSITRAQADVLLLRHLRGVCLPALLRACPALDDEPPERVGALMDWTYNLGEGNLRASTLRRRVNAGAWEQVRAELHRWVYACGVRLPGLVARRHEESQMM